MAITQGMGISSSVGFSNHRGVHSLHSLTDIKKQFWTYKHFGNFVKRQSVPIPIKKYKCLTASDLSIVAGSQRRAITGSDSTKFMMAVTDSSNFYIIAMNPNTADSTLTLTFPESVCATEAHRTSASEDFATIAAATRSGSNWLLPLRATSLNTYIFARRAC